MKIRIKGNTIRFRLTRSEVEAVATIGHLSEETVFAETSFRYAVRATKGLDGLNADFKEGAITLYMPVASAQEWWTTERVGFEHQLVLDNGNTLYLLIEKDFVCMDESTEDQSDNYPNPSAQKKNG